MYQLKKLIPNKNNIAQNTLWMFFGQGGKIVLQGGYFVFLARFLGADGLGVFSGALALVTIFASFGGVGSNSLLVMYVSRENDRFPMMLGYSIVTIIWTGLVLVLFVILINSFLLGSYIPFYVLLLLSFSEIVFYKFVDVFIASFQAYNRLKYSSLIIFSLSFCRFVLVIIFGFIIQSSSVLIWSSLYCTSTLFVAMVFFFIVGHKLSFPTFKILFSKKNLSEGFYFSLGLSSQSIYADSDKAILLKYSGNTITGAYTAAYRVVSMSFVPVKALLQSSYATFFKEGSSGIGNGFEFAKGLMPVTIIYSSLVSLIIFFGAPLLPKILGQDYQSSVVIVKWLAILPILQSMHYLIADTLTGANYQKERSIIQISTGSLNILLNFMLIPALNWKGAVISTIISEGLLGILLYIILKIKIKKELEDN